MIRIGIYIKVFFHFLMGFCILSHVYLMTQNKFFDFSFFFSSFFHLCDFKTPVRKNELISNIIKISVNIRDQAIDESVKYATNIFRTSISLPLPPPPQKKKNNNNDDNK